MCDIREAALRVFSRRRARSIRQAPIDISISSPRYRASEMNVLCEDRGCRVGCAVVGSAEALSESTFSVFRQ